MGAHDVRNNKTGRPLTTPRHGLARRTTDLPQAHSMVDRACHESRAIRERCTGTVSGFNDLYDLFVRKLRHHEEMGIIVHLAIHDEAELP